MAEKKSRTDIEELFKLMSSLNLNNGSHFYAKPTYLVDPHNFYIMPFTWLFHLPSLSKPGKPLQANELREHMTVVYKSENLDVNKFFGIELDEYIRGVILSIKDNECEMYALDRGFVEKNVTLDRIYHTKTVGASAAPSLIRHCALFFCAPIGGKFSEDAIEAFKFYMKNEKMSVVVKDSKDNKLIVQVYNSNPDDISTMLALTHYTYLSMNSNDLVKPPVKQTKPKPGYVHIELKAGETLAVRTQSGSSFSDFYVTPMYEYDDYLRNRSDFSNYCRSMPVISLEDFTSGTLVGVKDDAKVCYERGYILEVLGDKAKVKLVDWGNEIDVHKFKIVAIKSLVYIQPTVKALYCSAVEGFMAWDNLMLLKGYRFKITVKQVGKGFEIPHIVEITKNGNEPLTKKKILKKKNDLNNSK